MNILNYLMTSTATTIKNDILIRFVMKFYFSVLLAIAFSLCADSVYAQNKIIQHPSLGKKQIIDKSIIDCIYEHICYDPILDETRIVDEILEIGTNSSRYGDYGNYRSDSVVRKDYPNQKVGVYKLRELGRKYDSGDNAELIKYTAENKMVNYQRIFLDVYFYEEKIPDFQWTLIDGSDEICNYNCKKATMDFRGRKWTAWYCEDIQSDNGPWKFGGLPGLILKLEDDKHEHIFEAMQIRKGCQEFGFKLRSLQIKTTREKFNEMMADFRINIRSFLLNNPQAPTAPGGTPLPKRMFYNPVELN